MAKLLFETIVSDKHDTILPLVKSSPPLSSSSSSFECKKKEKNEASSNSKTQSKTKTKKKTSKSKSTKTMTAVEGSSNSRISSSCHCGLLRFMDDVTWSPCFEQCCATKNESRKCCKKVNGNRQGNDQSPNKKNKATADVTNADSSMLKLTGRKKVSTNKRSQKKDKIRNNDDGKKKNHRRLFKKKGKKKKQNGGGRGEEQSLTRRFWLSQSSCSSSATATTTANSTGSIKSVRMSIILRWDSHGFSGSTMVGALGGSRRQLANINPNKMPTRKPSDRIITHLSSSSSSDARS